MKRFGLEGSKKRVWHLRAERRSGLSKAKREQFKRRNKGRLFCERCRFEPVEEYGTELAESCIARAETLAPGRSTSSVDGAGRSGGSQRKPIILARPKPTLARDPNRPGA